MKKRILTLVAALALAATVVTPVSATTIVSDKVIIPAETDTMNLSDGSTKTVNTKITGSNGKELATRALNGTKTAYDGGVKFNEANVTSYVKDQITPALEDGIKQKDIKLSGEATQAATTTTVANFVATNSVTATVGTVGGDAKDNLHDNAINPAVKEFVKVSLKNALGDEQSGKASVSNIKGIAFFELKGAQAGDMTIKLPDDTAGGFDNYAIVLHYTGNASDDDGVTAQYVKVSAGGKLTAHFNSYSPVAIILTDKDSAQSLVNTYNHSIGSDEVGGAAATTTTTTATTTPVATPVETTATTATTDANAAAGKTAASPKTGDNAYALYLILAVAAVAGTTLVATKKTR